MAGRSALKQATLAVQRSKNSLMVLRRVMKVVKSERSSRSGRWSTLFKRDLHSEIEAEFSVVELLLRRLFSHVLRNVILQVLKRFFVTVGIRITD